MFLDCNREQASVSVTNEDREQLLNSCVCLCYPRGFLTSKSEYRGSISAFNWELYVGDFCVFLHVGSPGEAFIVISGGVHPYMVTKYIVTYCFFTVWPYSFLVWKKKMLCSSLPFPHFLPSFFCSRVCCLWGFLPFFFFISFLRGTWVFTHGPFLTAAAK